jgi:hypothetical protein
MKTSLIVTYHDPEEPSWITKEPEHEIEREIREIFEAFDGEKYGTSCGRDECQVEYDVPEDRVVECRSAQTSAGFKVEVREASQIVYVYIGDGDGEGLGQVVDMGKGVARDHEWGPPQGIKGIGTGWTFDAKNDEEADAILSMFELGMPYEEARAASWYVMGLSE